jgi:hypothetical protein
MKKGNEKKRENVKEKGGKGRKGERKEKCK